MSSITTFITAFCTACIVIGSLHIICPDGSVGKSVKYTLSLVFLLVIISAAGINLKSQSFSFPKYESNEKSIEEANIASAKYVYSTILQKAGINFRKITVCTDKTEDGSIIITKVIVYSDDSKEAIINALGVVAENHEVEIVNE